MFVKLVYLKVLRNSSLNSSLNLLKIAKQRNLFITQSIFIHMQRITTKDSSYTFYNEEFDEYYHSLSGAHEEAREKYAIPALKFYEKYLINAKKITLLDFCFGTGYNSLVFIQQMRKAGHTLPIHIIALERDQEIIEQGKIVLKDLYEEMHKDSNVTLTHIMGNAEQTINNTFFQEHTIDICFFDPFSPKKCPVLWTGEIFKTIYNYMNTPALLSTYSCARAVRDHLREAGFKVADGPTVGRNAPATLAYKE